MNSIPNTNTAHTSSYTVFECIRRLGPITKKELQARTGLSWGSISAYTSGLLSKEIIVEKTKTQDFKGRNPSSYRINQNQNWIIGLDVQMNRIIGNVLALDGTSLCSTVLNLEQCDAPHVYENIITALSFLFRSMVNASQIRWIGLSMPGLINFVHGKPMRVHHFTGVFPAYMLEKLEQQFGVPVSIFHDPDCMLIAHLSRQPSEEMSRLSKNSSIILLRWSYGIGLSLMLDGELFFGAHHAAGEMGHMTVNSDGPVCICGKNGCLETYAAIRSVIRSVRQSIENGSCPGGEDMLEGGILRKEAIWNAYQAGNPCVQDIVNDAIDYMAIAVSNTINLLDPSLLIIEGEFGAAPQACMERFSAKVNAGLVRGRPLDIQFHCWEISPAVGAAAMLVEHVFDKIYTEREPIRT